MAAPDRMEVAHLHGEKVSSSLQLQEFAAALNETLNVERVMSALAAEEFDWRTLDGLERSTRLPGATIMKIIEAHIERIESKESEQFGTIFRRKDLKMAPPRGILSRLDKVLDYMSFGARRIVKP